MDMAMDPRSRAKLSTFHRSPEEMRAKMSVHFQGEEGIDAGGVSREWYQVIHHLSFTLWLSVFHTVGI